MAPFLSRLADHITAGSCFRRQLCCTIVKQRFLIILVPARHYQMQLRSIFSRMKVPLILFGSTPRFARAFYKPWALRTAS